MLTFLGERRGRYCDGMPRRDFLRIGGAVFGGLTLSQLLREEAKAGANATRKSIINIFLGGGPTHMDTFDLKPEAPPEYRGEFRPIATNVPGVEICELMPHLASVADKYTIVRSITDFRNEHHPKQSESGFSMQELRSIGGRPGIQSVLSKVWGPAQQTPHGTAPTSVDLTGWTNPGFLGQVHSAYRPDSTGRNNLLLNRSVSLERLSDRQALLSGLDRMRRETDSTGMMTAMDSFADRAIGIITSGKLYRALDLNSEDPRTVERYGRYGGNDRFLIARRLISAGVRSVSFSWGGWDTHGQNFVTMRRQLPPLSQALTALIEDLDAHGLLEQTIIMMSGEFGRTPRVNGSAGRDHWPQAAFFFLAGGGFRHGQVIGATDRRGERPIKRPLHLQQVFATVYRQLGIDPETTTLIDPNGRPQYLAYYRQPIDELI